MGTLKKDYENMNPRSIANSSGFPLQIRIGHVANSSGSWRVHLEEHPWQSIDNSREGFIDLVLIEKHGVQTMVVECKRVRDSSWIFMIPIVDCRERSHVRLWCSDQSTDRWKEFGWTDWQGIDSHEAKYCAIPGQEQGRRNLLERTAAELVEATESFAWQEKELADKVPPTIRAFRRIYIPVIVTTAELKVSCFDPSTISLAEGDLPPDTTFTTVPYVKFRKSLSSRIDTESSIDQARDLHRASERSVFVVNAENFNVFIGGWEINR
jgi:hypothetical protein